MAPRPRRGAGKTWTYYLVFCRGDRPGTVRREAIIFLHDVLPDRAFDAFIRRATGVPS